MPFFAAFEKFNRLDEFQEDIRHATFCVKCRFKTCQRLPHDTDEENETFIDGYSVNGVFILNKDKFVPLCGIRARIFDI